MWKYLKQFPAHHLLTSFTAYIGISTSSLVKRKRLAFQEKKALGKYGSVNTDDVRCGATDGRDDEDTRLFESEEEQRSRRLKEECLVQYKSKKTKKPILLAKSSLSLDVKPWDDETNMAK